MNETVQFPEKKRIVVEYSIDDMIKLHKFKEIAQKKKLNDEKKKILKQNTVENVGKKVKVTAIPKRTMRDEEEETGSKKKDRKGKKPVNRKVAMTKKFNAKKSVLL